jgi:hypothetical protein
MAWDRLFDRVLREIGMDSSSWNPSARQLELVCDYVSERFEKAYQFDWWPVLCPVVERPVVDEGDGRFVRWQMQPNDSGLVVEGLTNAATLDGNGEYVRAGSLNGRALFSRVADTRTWWVYWDNGAAQWRIGYGEIDVVVAIVSMSEDDVLWPWMALFPGPAATVVTERPDPGAYEPMDAIMDVFAQDPHVSCGPPIRRGYRLSWRGIELGACDVGDSVWIRFRLRPPRVTRTAWADDEAYGLDDVVYADGTCFRSLQNGNLGHAVSDEAWWEPQFLPGMFGRYIAKAVLADWQRRFGDSQEAADRESGRAEAELERLSDVMVPAQRQHERAHVRLT